MSVWLEANLSKLELLPTGQGGSTGAHTAGATIESNMRSIRRIAHKCETAMIENGISYTAESLFAEVMWCLNSTPQHAGVTSS